MKLEDFAKMRDARLASPEYRAWVSLRDSVLATLEASRQPIPGRLIRGYRASAVGREAVRLEADPKVLAKMLEPLRAAGFDVKTVGLTLEVRRRK